MENEKPPVLATVTDVVVNIGKCSCHSRPGYACHYCGNDPNHRDFCPHCGYPQRSKLILPGSGESDGYK